MIKIEQLVDLLQVSDSTIRRWIKEGMPNYKVGNVLRFDLDAVKEWMQNKEG